MLGAAITDSGVRNKDFKFHYNFSIHINTLTINGADNPFFCQLMAHHIANYSNQNSLQIETVEFSDVKIMRN